MKLTKMLILLGSIVLITAACTEQTLSSEDAQKANKRVKISEVKAMSMGEAMKVDAKIMPSSRIDIASETSGKLIQKQVEIGDVVEQGQILFKLDQIEHESALKRARLAKERVLIELENFKLQLREDNQSNKQLDLVKLSLREAELSIEDASRNLQKTTITSPMSGIIVDLPGLSVGQQINPGQMLVQIEQLDPLHVEATITENDMLDIQQQTQFPVYFPALDRNQNADVLYITPLPEGSQRNGFTIKSKISNQNGDLRPGMSAQLILDNSRAEETLVVAIAAVLEEDGQSFVYTLSDASEVNQTQVKIGRKNKDFAEIITGLGVGDKIVIVGQSLLSDGDSVEVIE